MKKKFYFTLGQIHTHRINGKTIDCDGVIEIIADNSVAARNKMFDMCGRKWAMQYDEDKICFDYFPNGIVLSVKA